MNLAKNKIAIVFPRTRPSHIARLSSIAAQRKYIVIGIEVIASNKTSFWGGLEQSQPFCGYTLFYENTRERLDSASVWKELQKMLDTISPQVIAVAGWSDPSALAALAWACSRKVPPVLMSETTVKDGNRQIWKEAVKRRIIQAFPAALVGGTPQSQYLQNMGFPKYCIFRGYNVVDNTHFWSGAQEARANPEYFRHKFRLPPQYFLVSSRLVEKKNLFRVIEAYARYRSEVGEQAWDLVIVGEGTLRNKLESYVKALGIANAVSLPGWQKYNNLPYFYGLAGAFIHASTVEPWGMVVNEALAAGLPVIISDRCGCASDLVKDGSNGFTFDPHNTDQLAFFIKKIASSNLDRQLLGRASKEIIDAWSPEIFADNLLKAANQVLATPRFNFLFGNRTLLWLLAQRGV